MTGHSQNRKKLYSSYNESRLVSLNMESWAIQLQFWELETLSHQRDRLKCCTKNHLTQQSSLRSICQPLPISVPSCFNRSPPCPLYLATLFFCLFLQPQGVLSLVLPLSGMLCHRCLDDWWLLICQLQHPILTEAFPGHLRENSWAPSPYATNSILLSFFFFLAM